ncbi:luciferase family oxidoreductase, group 1, partial [Mesomycoplasma hyorhinis]
MKFSILDQGLIDKNTSSEQALSNTIELAKNAEKLGYFSFW